MRLRPLRLLPVVFLLILGACTLGSDASDTNASPSDPSDALPDGEVVMDRVESEKATFRVRQVVDDVAHGWAVAWLPDGRTLITERAGTLLLIDGRSRTEISGLPEVWASGQGGLLDLRLHPNYADTGWIYMTYSAPADGGARTELARAKLDGTTLTDVEVLYRQFPAKPSAIHFGSRIAFLNDGTMVVALGERGQRRANGDGAQDSTNTIGTTIRLTLDGEIPADNPFVGRDDVPDEIYSYGHRNQQGMAIHPETGAIWQHEHGPHGGDELNLVEPGKNYGWPAVSYGDTYSTPHQPIGGEEGPGFTQPVTYWDPSPALSGMAFYTGDRFSAWENDLFLGALAHKKLLRVELNGQTVAHQEELLRDDLGRVRDVATGPDGYLYVLTDAKKGALYRLEPVK